VYFFTIASRLINSLRSLSSALYLPVGWWFPFGGLVGVGSLALSLADEAFMHILVGSLTSL